VSLYRYVTNSPHNAIDPQGLFNKNEADQIGTWADAITTAKNISFDTATGFYNMHWGRFVVAMGGKDMWRAIDLLNTSFEKTPFPRYIYTCRCGMIDLKHFYQLMYIAVYRGNRVAVQQGIEYEESDNASSKYAQKTLLQTHSVLISGVSRLTIQARTLLLTISGHFSRYVTQSTGEHLRKTKKTA
jgi:hypothetical protein